MTKSTDITVCVLMDSPTHTVKQVNKLTIHLQGVSLLLKIELLSITFKEFRVVSDYRFMRLGFKKCRQKVYTVRNQK